MKSYRSLFASFSAAQIDANTFLSN